MKLKDLNQSTLCVQAFNGIKIYADGKAGICCEISETLEDISPLKKNFSEILNHPSYHNMRQEMLNNKRPKACWRCYEREDLGGRSLRQELNEYFYEKNNGFDETKIEAQNIEFILGNNCQLRCIMCHPSRSKNVTGTFKKVIQDGMRPSFEGHVQVDSSFSTDWMDSDIVWEHLISESKTGKRFFLNGGEPLLARQHLKILQKLISLDLASSVQLVYATNGLLINDEILEIWKKFDKVEVAISIDDIGDRNEFIRNPSSWSKISKTLELVANWQLNVEYKNIQFGIWCAINFLSVPYLKDYLNYFNTNFPKINIKGWRPVQSPSFLSPAVLSQDQRNAYCNEALEWISANPNYKHLSETLEMIREMEHKPEIWSDSKAYLKSCSQHFKIDHEKLFSRINFLD